MSDIRELNEYENKSGHSKSALKDLFDIVGDMLRLIKANLLIFVLIIAVFTVGALGYSVYSYEELYEATATFSITPLVVSDSTNGISVYKFNYTSSFAEQMSETFPYIAQSGNLRDVIKNDLGGWINGSIEATAVTSTNVFQVTVKSSSATDAVAIMDSFIKNFPKISEYIMGDTKLNIIYRSDVPTEPINSADNLRHTLYGTAFGLLINAVLFFVLAINRETIRSKEDIATKLNSKCICEIPHVKQNRGSNTSKTKILHMGPKHPGYSEAIRTVKKRITSLISEGDKIIGVTSAVGKEGKTTIAFNLATAYSKGDAKVVLVDLDLFGRNLQRLLLKRPDEINGLSEYCKSDDSKIDSFIYNYKNKFDVIFAGSEKLKSSSVKLSQVMEELREKYDYVIVDMPACGLNSEVTTIADLCDDVFFTVRFDSTSLSNIKKALQYILYSKTKFLGFVINDCGFNSSNGYNYYGRYRSYGYRRYGYYNSSYRYGYGYGIDELKPDKKGEE